MRRVALLFGLLILVLLAGVGLYLSGAWIPNAPDTADYPVRGIDVSHHQGRIDWQGVGDDGGDFAYIKATEGGDWQDGEFARNWEEAGKAGLKRGAYHFFTLRTPGLEQAENFIAHVPRDQAALPPAVDLEFPGNSKARPTVEEFREELSRFLMELEEHYQTQPVLYTTYRFYHHYLQGFEIDRLWIRDVLAEPRGFSRGHWIFWQYSDRGRTAGIKGPVDQNVFVGDESALQAASFLFPITHDTSPHPITVPSDRNH